MQYEIARVQRAALRCQILSDVFDIAPSRFNVEDNNCMQAGILMKMMNHPHAQSYIKNSHILLVIHDYAIQKLKEMHGEKTAFCQYFRDPPKISQIMFSGGLMSH